MFIQTFGLARDPFMDTADPSFYFETIGSANGRRRLTESLLAGRGLAVVVGPIGAGKTTLCNAVQEDVLEHPDVRAGLILDPAFADEREFLITIAATLGVAIDAGEPERALKDDLKRALFASVASGTQYVLFIDEAQTLPESMFETLRGLLNYQVDQRKLLSVALSGQMELVPMLARHANIADRIAVWIELGPLRASEAAALVDHRLRRAGFSGAQSPFEPSAAELLWRQSGGLPRRLTTLARESMEIAAERGSRSVVEADVQGASLRAAPSPSAQAPLVPDVRTVAETVNSGRATRARWPWSLFSP